MTTAHIIGTPLDLGAEELGVDKGPQALRNRNLVQKLQESGLAVTDGGDIEVSKRATLETGDPKTPYISEIARVCEEVAKQTEEAIRADTKPVVLGGDHSVNLGAFSGAVAATNESIGLIYIDAHGDINTPESSLSHNIHGMHLASLMGFGTDTMTKLYTPGVKLPKENLLHVAGTNFDQAEIELIGEVAMN